MNTYKLNPESLNFTIKIVQNNSSEMHTHDFFEFIVMQSGAISHTSSDVNINIMQGDIVMLAPGTTHTYSTLKSSSHYDILIRPSFLKEICDFLDGDLYSFYVNKKIMRKTISLRSLSALEHQITSWQETIDIKTKKIIEKIITSLLLSFMLDEKNDNQDKSSFKELCLKAINEYYSLPDALKRIHNELGYNEIYLCKKFKKCFGCTLVEYINNLRLTYAAYLFQTMNFNVTECMSHIGLNSMPYFNKIFKEKYGMTPSQYRKQYNERS